MSDLTKCDVCSRTYPKSEGRFSLSLWDEKYDGNEVEWDVCSRCITIVRKGLKKISWPVKA